MTALSETYLVSISMEEPIIKEGVGNDNRVNKQKEQTRTNVITALCLICIPRNFQYILYLHETLIHWPLSKAARSSLSNSQAPAPLSKGT